MQYMEDTLVSFEQKNYLELKGDVFNAVHGRYSCIFLRNIFKIRFFCKGLRRNEIPIKRNQIINSCKNLCMRVSYYKVLIYLRTNKSQRMCQDVTIIHKRVVHIRDM
jgi:hypothetical protein